MRIAIVTTSYPSSAGDPSGHFVAAEADVLAARGNRVTVLAPGRRGARLESNPTVVRVADGQAFGWPGALARLRHRPHRLLGAMDFVRAARRELALLGPFDRVIAHFIVPCAWPIAVASDAPLEVVAHGSDVRLLLALPRKLCTALIRGLLRRGACFRFVSAELRHALAERSGLPELTGARVLASPIDLGEVLPHRSARSLIRAWPGERLIVVISRLIEQKRVDVALSAALLVPNARIVVIGDGPERARLERLFDGVRFTGRLPRPDALCWLSAADLLLCASRREGAPTVVREARALGVPVVAVPAGDLAAWAALDPGITLVSPH